MQRNSINIDKVTKDTSSDKFSSIFTTEILENWKNSVHKETQNEESHKLEENLKKR